MTEKDIRKYIDRLNKGKGQETIFRRQISKNVELAKVWSRRIHISLDFFFIKNNEGEFIGAINYMEDDLHWYIIPKYRKQGHLSKSLNETILPYIFKNKRKSQTITINPKDEIDCQNSKKVALKIGFKPDHFNGNFKLEEKDFNFKNQKLNEQYGMDDKRIKILKKRLENITKNLLKISNEFEMAFGGISELPEIAKKIEQNDWNLENLINSKK
jgi:hypothetical protein